MIQEYKQLINSEKFKSWKNKSKDAYLCSVFLLKDEEKSSDWQFDYYLLEKNKMTTFIVGKNIEVSKNQKIFSSSKKIEEINLK
ncbi:MAG: hypothetical protein AABX45_00230, partial [Nanoarchaeota archaeon]